METSRKVMTLVALAATTSAGFSQSKHHKQGTTNVGEELRQLHDAVQSLQQQLSQRDGQLLDMQRKLDALENRSAAIDATGKSAASAEQQNAVSVSNLQSAVSQLQSSSADLDTQVKEVRQTATDTKKEIEQPSSIHYKDITITPGGFLAADTVWRQRSLDADIFTNWNGQPYPGSGLAHISEFVPTARASRPAVVLAAKMPFGTFKGMLETDFLSAGTTSNNLQTNSYTLRVRQAWAQIAWNKNIFTGGEMWSLLTEDKKGATPGQENFPLFFDANYHVGFTYSRQPAFRYERVLSPNLTLAASLENSQYQFSAANASSNFFFGSPGNSSGVENPDANYTNQVAPDIAVKAAFDPGYGHYEVGGILRFFRDRYYPGYPSTSDATNDTKVGGGLSVSARLPITGKLDVGAHLVAGDGTGRYGASVLPDITVHPDGTLAQLRNAQGIFSLEYHPNRRWDLFGYAGTEYVQRTYYVGADGKLVGYAPPTADNSGCFNETAPTAGTGYAPGSGKCAGSTRDLVQGSGGWIYHIYSGPYGRLQYGAAYSYIIRSAWTGIGGAPRATNNMVYTSFRYYIP